MKEGDKFITVNDIVSQLLEKNIKFSSRTLREMAKDGRFPPSINIQNKHFWKQSDLDLWLENKINARG